MNLERKIWLHIQFVVDLMDRCINCYEDTNTTARALCKKLFGRKTTKIMCMNCLASYLEVTEDELLEMADDFKKQGCDLFE
jgi:alpha-galactosidase